MKNICTMKGVLRINSTYAAMARFSHLCPLRLPAAPPDASAYFGFCLFCYLEASSLAQSRTTTFFSAAYLAAEALIIGLMICWSAV